MNRLNNDSPFEDSRQQFAAGRFGMILFLVSIGMLFAATILCYLFVRLNPDPTIPWRLPGEPGLPGLLAASTVVLVVSSITLWAAQAGIVHGTQTRWLATTLVLGLLFLLMQGVAWWQLYSEQVTITDGLFAWTFYVLTGLHALHVIGGIVPMAVVPRRSARGMYSADHHDGITYCAMYWHFLDAVWIILYATLWFGSLSGAA